MFYPSERTAVFIDGANMYGAAKAIGFDIDYKRLLDLFKARARLIRAYYYTAIIDDQAHDPLRPLIDFLTYNGYAVVTKPAKRMTDRSTGQQFLKGNMDIELAIDLLELAPAIDHAVLFSGDGDFRRLVEAVQRRGVRVTVVSAMRTLADELRRQADQFVDLVELEGEIARPRPSTPSSALADAFSAARHEAPARAEPAAPRD